MKVGTSIRNLMHKPYLDHRYKKGRLQQLTNELSQDNFEEREGKANALKSLNSNSSDASSSDLSFEEAEQAEQTHRRQMSQAELQKSLNLDDDRHHNVQPKVIEKHVSIIHESSPSGSAGDNQSTEYNLQLPSTNEILTKYNSKGHVPQRQRQAIESSLQNL